MSEKVRYLTDEELLHDGFGEGFGSIPQALPETRTLIIRRYANGASDSSTLCHEITAGDKLAASDMSFEGGIIFNHQPLNKKHLES